MDKPVKIESMVMKSSGFPTVIDDYKVSVKFGIAFAEHKSEMLVRAILDELKNRNVPEAFIVNPEFVEQAIREKLELGNINYDRLRELVEADRDGRCVVLPFRPPKTVYSCSKHFPKPEQAHYASEINIMWDMDRGCVFGDTPEAAEAALKAREQDG